MRTENEFNAKFGANLRKLEPEGFLTLKVSEKFHTGIPDFFIWYDSRCAAVETKFVREMPKGRGKVLGHPFDGKQLTFLKRVYRTGNPAWGLIALEQTKSVLLVYYTDIPEDGNWQGDIPRDRCFEFSYDDYRGVVEKIFQRRPQGEH